MKEGMVVWFEVGDRVFVNIDPKVKGDVHAYHPGLKKVWVRLPITGVQTFDECELTKIINPHCVPDPEFAKGLIPGGNGRSDYIPRTSKQGEDYDDTSIANMLRQADKMGITDPDSDSEAHEKSVTAKKPGRPAKKKTDPTPEKPRQPRTKKAPTPKPSPAPRNIPVKSLTLVETLGILGVSRHELAIMELEGEIRAIAPIGPPRYRETDVLAARQSRQGE